MGKATPQNPEYPIGAKVPSGPMVTQAIVTEVCLKNRSAMTLHSGKSRWQSGDYYYSGSLYTVIDVGNSNHSLRLIDNISKHLNYVPSK